MRDTSSTGFTLIEMMIILGIIAVLLMLAMPSMTPITIRGQIKEAVEIAAKLEPSVETIYGLTGKFPKDNDAAGLPPANKLLGSYVQGIELKDGAFHIKLGNKVNASVAGKIVTLQPVAVDDSPASPLSWVCGMAATPDGMSRVGENRTDVSLEMLPVKCRI